MNFREIREGVWQSQGKNPVRVYASKRIMDQMEKGVYKQAENVSQLPGLIDSAMVMPDGHYGYGFPIGGVAAFDLQEGVVSPGGVGYDINCGVHMLSTNLSSKEVKPRLKKIINSLFSKIPSGVGRKSKLKLSKGQLQNALVDGAKWAVENGYGYEQDLERMEENGRIQQANPDKVSNRALSRGQPQLGTLGGGNHFLEIQKVDKIFDPQIAETFGVKREGQVMVMIHCGSRGFGHQVADEYIKKMLGAAKRHKIDLPDKELACAPISSKEAEDYFGAMFCGVNFAFCNRQVIGHWTREVFQDHFSDLKMPMVYDVCHNIAKFEKHEVDGKQKEVCIHRKGATRAFPKGRKEVPSVYRDVGQPVIIPGDMGTASYLLVGTETALEETFGSTCHGAGRTMSRTGAIKKFWGGDVRKELESRGQEVAATHDKILAEEYSKAYKEIDEVIDSVKVSGLSEPVARLKPMGVVKG